MKTETFVRDARKLARLLARANGAAHLLAAAAGQGGKYDLAGLAAQLASGCLHARLRAAQLARQARKGGGP